MKEDGNYSSCEACAWGYRKFNSDIQTIRDVCQRCDIPLGLYDWLYLGFMALIPFLLHSFFIEYCAELKCTLKILILQHAASAAECGLATLLSLLVVPPVGSPKLVGCGVVRLSDWYTMFFNPTINYTTTMHCTQEAVYPLYSLPFIYYGFCLLNLLIIRSAVLLPFNVKKSGAGSAVYAALYFFPIITLAHALFAGVVYYSFPEILLLSSLLTNAVHFAKYPEQSLKKLVQLTVRDWRNACVALTHCFLYAYCVASFTQFTQPLFHACLLLLIPVPAVFYVLTAGVSDPKKLMA